MHTRRETETFSYKQPMGTTARVASILDEGQTFQENRTPSLSSAP